MTYEKIELVGVNVNKLIDDLSGAIYDFIKFIFKSICYLLAGMLIVGVPLYAIAFAFRLFR
jgi:hypothetical protein